MPRIGRLWEWHRWGVYAALLVCAASGVAWFVLRDLLALEPSPSDRMVIMAHGIGGFLALMALGSVLPVHVRLTWNAGRNRLSGATALALLAVLSVTALGLYYGTESTHPAFKWTHVVLGLAAVALFPLHIVLGRRTTRLGTEAENDDARRRYG